MLFKGKIMLFILDINVMKIFSEIILNELDFNYKKGLNIKQSAILILFNTFVRVTNDLN